MDGKIVALSCGMYSVECNGVIYRAPARGLFRSKSLKPVVGDNVDLDEENCVIRLIYPRTSELKRPQIANIDQMLIVESLAQPGFSYLLAFKYLTYANMNNIKAKIILTKSDLFDDDNNLKDIIETFEKMNIEIHVISNKTGVGVEEVRKLFANHTTCLIGQTGVGKSSLINTIDPSYERAIGEFSYALGRGKHQTKEVILLPYQGGYIADTPGFSSLDLDLYKEDLAQYFPGFSEKYLDCYFSNCLHISENRCVIKEEIAKGNIPEIAYECYLKLSSEAIYKSRRYE